jgi:hypothetical protein
LIIVQNNEKGKESSNIKTRKGLAVRRAREMPNFIDGTARNRENEVCQKIKTIKNGGRKKD